MSEYKTEALKIAVSQQAALIEEAKWLAKCEGLRRAAARGIALGLMEIKKRGSHR